ncbi:ribbon-helix-helix protein, CopG family [Streptomyces sp. BPTC-684]|uniref:ribbon-helix-helix protein, CopG family n=1 Tax=Streptomyces sp. BPTC-684 TaxID=3043734 RepID=UPI0024B24C9D|nr:ribbon-helix-helix protein, CopG family [Streptomyces sp. BPTC-684]WHM41095.1 ribbon-helix-helix protein, CopG family [Streptomyces sp. BPTC-684]
MPKERVTITLSEESAAALRKLADAGQIESVSAYVAEAVEDRLARQERAARVISRWAAEAEKDNPTEWAKALEWARSTAHKDEAAAQGAA